MLIVAFCYSHNSYCSFAVDSLTLEVEHSKAFKKQIDFAKLYLEGRRVIKLNPEKAFRIAFELQRIAIKENKDELHFLADYFLGLCNYYFSNSEKAIENFETAEKIALKNNWYDSQTKVYLFFASLYQLKKNHEEAEKYYKRALNIALKKNVNPKILLETYEHYGLCYYYTPRKDTVKRKYFYGMIEKGLNLAIKLKDSIQIGVFYTKLGEAAYVVTNLPKSLHYINASINILSKIGNIEYLGNSYKVIGDIYYEKNNYDSALFFYKKSYELKEKTGRQSLKAIAATDVAYMYGLTGNKKLLDQYADTALKYQSLDKTGDGKIYSFRWLSDIYSKTNDYKRTIQLYAQYTNILDSAIRNSNSVTLARHSLQTDFDNQLRSIKEKENREKALQKKESEYQTFISRIYLFGLIGFIIFSLIIFREFQLNKKQRLVIQKQHEDVSEKSKIIEEKNKEMTDSINYAQRIQSGLLTAKEGLSSIFHSSFIYYRPKDILSGDFYWYAQKEDFVFVACGDCTGHGVPGALMSVLGINLLNDILENKQELEPAKILDALRTGVIRALNKDQSTIEYKDGMDISLVRIHKKSGKAIYSGANNSIYLLRTDGIEEIVAHKQPVGFSPKMSPFSQHEFSFQNGDGIILFTDGFPDQFGGPSNKKYQYKPFKNFVANLFTLKNVNPENIFENEFLRWKGNNEQLDDICIIGIKF